MNGSFKRFQKKEMTFLIRRFFPLLATGTLGMMVVTVLLMSDMMIAGIFIGEDAVAGINLVTPIYSLAYFFVGLVSIGVPILYSNAMGKFDKEAADGYFGNGLTAAVIVGIVLFAAVALAGKACLQSFHATEAVLGQAEPYLFWYGFVILILPIYYVMSEMVLADGDGVISLLANLLLVLGNILLSVILCRIIGVAGIGIGTLVAMGLAVLVCFIHFMRKGNSLRLHFAFSWKIVTKISRYSAIDAGSYLFLALLGAVLNWFVPWAFGADMLILVSVVLFMKELQLIFDGIGEAIKPIMSIYLGEGSYAGIRNCWKIAQKTAILEGIAVMVFLILLAPLIVRMLGISDPEVIVYAVRGIRVMSLGLPFVSLLFLAASYYLVRSRILLGLGLSGLRDVFATAPMALIGGITFGVYGMMAGIAAASLIAYILFFCYISRRYGREDCPLLLNELDEGHRYGFYELTLTLEEIIDLQKQVDEMLRSYGVPEDTVLLVKMLTEDLFMLVRERNGSRTVYAECTVTVKDEGVQIITKDDGELFDLTEDDMRVTSLLVFTVTGITRNLRENKNNLTTMSYNRNVFLVKWKTM